MPNRLLSLAIALGINALAVAVLVAGCGSDNNSTSSSSTSPTPSSSTTGGGSAVCTAIDQLATDTKAMTDDTTVQQFQASLTAVGNDLKDVKAQAQAEFAGPVDDVQKALTAFGDELKSVGNGQGAMKTLEALGKAAGNVSDSVQALASQASCPSS